MRPDLEAAIRADMAVNVAKVIDMVAIGMSDGQPAANAAFLRQIIERLEERASRLERSPQ